MTTLNPYYSVLAGAVADAEDVNQFAKGAPRRRGVRRIDTLDAGSNSVPVMIAHRGFSRSAPENTMAAFRAAIAVGAKVLETDINWSSDGVPVILHDSDISRTAIAFGGAPSAYSASELMNLDFGTFYSPDFAREGMPTLYDVLREFGNKATLILEVKNGYAGGTHADAANRIAAIVADHGLEDSVVIASFNDLSISAGCVAFSQYGIPVLRYTGTIAADGTVSAASAAAHLAGGYGYLGIDYNAANLATGSAIWTGLGMKVFCYTPESRYARDLALASTPTTGIITGDPLWLQKPNLPSLTVAQNIPFNARVIPAGCVPIRTNTGPARIEGWSAVTDFGWSAPPGGIGWPQQNADTFGGVARQDWLNCSPIGWGASVGKIGATATLIDPVVADTSRWFGLGAWTDDRGHVDGAGTDTSTGYMGLIRQSGLIQLYRVDATGVVTSLGSTAGAALTAGTSYPFTLEVTATNVILTGNAVSVNVADATYRSLTCPAIGRSQLGVTFDAVARSI